MEIKRVLLTTYYLILTTYYLLLTTYWLGWDGIGHPGIGTTYYLLVMMYYLPLLLVTCYLLLATYYLLFAINASTCVQLHLGFSSCAGLYALAMC